MDRAARLESAAGTIFRHHLYEYRKGVRPLFMMTLAADDSAAVIEALREASVDYHVHEVAAAKVNLFFGRRALVETAKSIVTKPLSRLSPEEDFILGTLLSYDREQQCERYLARIARERET